MFEKLLRRTILKSLSQEDFDAEMLLKDRTNADANASVMISIFWMLPIWLMLFILIVWGNSVSNIIQCLIVINFYVLFLCFFVKKFKDQIATFKKLLGDKLYLPYVVNGNAISSEDFETIKKENEGLYNVIMLQGCRGYCYHVCFSILESLKKGTMQFFAVKSLSADENDNEYTIHVLYINDGWCFDTYSQRQHPVEEVMKRMKAKLYKSYSYEDIKGKTYEQFKEEENPALKEWCQANDCYVKWLKD